MIFRILKIFPTYIKVTIFSNIEQFLPLIRNDGLKPPHNLHIDTRVRRLKNAFGYHNSDKVSFYLKYRKRKFFAVSIFALHEISARIYSLLSTEQNYRREDS